MQFKKSLLPLMLITLSQPVFAEVECELTEINAWDFGFVLNQIKVHNNSNQTINDWTVYLHFDRTISITNAWGGRYDKNQSKVFEVKPMEYNNELLGFDSVYFGLQGELSSRLTLDDIQCYNRREHQAILAAEAEKAAETSSESGDLP